ncbi:DUF4476 domain-containing protein [Candidatus Mcinerneyibacteriota bacterium]|nr:DUF4476 domain-containing protein [Candidatus Mcinerneyibacteriota bacterium]
MKKAVIVVCLLLLFWGLTEGKEVKAQKKEKKQKAMVEESIRAIKKELTEIERRFLQHLTYFERKEYEKRMNRIDQLLSRIGEAEFEEDEEEPLQENLPMSEDAFEDSVRVLREKYSFDRDRLSFISTLVSGQWVSAQQAQRLLKEIQFDANRVKAFKDLYPKITDKENVSMVLEVFEFSSYRRDAEDFVKAWNEQK